VRVLLDTSAFLWWITADGAAVTPPARAVIEDPDNHVFLSVVSAWEIAIKAGQGRLVMASPAHALPEFIERYRLDVLPVQLGHALRVGELPPIHGDPFDRLLVAQSQVERMPLVTADAVLGRYDVETIW
jgi:PIN domain nuclease of toxin-antitoxin system